MSSDTASDVLGDVGQLLTFAEAAKLLPPSRRQAKPIHSTTLSRWRYPGVAVDGKAPVTLRCVRLPSGWMTTREWLNEFFEQLTAAATGQAEMSTPQASRTPARRRRQHERAERELTAAGF